MKSVVIFLVLLAFTGKADAQILIGVQFKGGGTALTSGQTAGVVPQANYNVVTGNTGTDLALMDSTGALSSATLTFSSTDLWSTGAGNSTPDNTLLSGKIGPNYNGSATVTINNLAAGTYELILYTVNDTAAQTASFTVGGIPYYIADQAGSDFNGTYIQGTNTDPSLAASSVATYLDFTDIEIASGDSLTLTSTQLIPSGTGAGDFNGFQLIATSVPEPSDVTLLLGGLAILISVLRNRKSQEQIIG